MENKLVKVEISGDNSGMFWLSSVEKNDVVYSQGDY
jgi:hypothetical protein